MIRKRNKSCLPPPCMRNTSGTRKANFLFNIRRMVRIFLYFLVRALPLHKENGKCFIKNLTDAFEKDKIYPIKVFSSLYPPPKFNKKLSLKV